MLGLFLGAATESCVQKKIRGGSEFLSGFGTLQLGLLP